MPLAPDLAGRSLPPGPEHDVSRSAVAAFARAIGADDPVHHDVDAARAAGHADVVAPVTYPITVAFGAMTAMMADPDVGIELRHVVHADQRFEYVRPVVAGDRLVATLTVESVRTMAGSDLISTSTRVTDADGDLVCTAYAKLAHTAPAQLAHTAPAQGAS